MNEICSFIMRMEASDSHSLHLYHLQQLLLQGAALALDFYGLASGCEMHDGA